MFPEEDADLNDDDEEDEDDDDEEELIIIEEPNGVVSTLWLLAEASS